MRQIYVRVWHFIAVNMHMALCCLMKRIYEWKESAGIIVSYMSNIQCFCAVPECLYHTTWGKRSEKLNLWTTSCTRPCVAVAQSLSVPTRPVTSRPIQYIKTFGDCCRLHRFLASYRCPYISKKHARIWVQRCVEIWKQSVKNFRRLFQAPPLPLQI
jgi:hypothetical protein